MWVGNSPQCVSRKQSILCLFLSVSLWLSDPEGFSGSCFYCSWMFTIPFFSSCSSFSFSLLPPSSLSSSYFFIFIFSSSSGSSSSSSGSSFSSFPYTFINLLLASCSTFFLSSEDWPGNYSFLWFRHLRPFSYFFRVIHHFDVLDVHSLLFPTHLSCFLKVYLDVL